MLLIASESLLRPIVLTVGGAFYVFCFLMAFASCLGVKLDINRVGNMAMKFTLGTIIVFYALWWGLG
jgi:hypothetical protein